MKEKDDRYYWIQKRINELRRDWTGKTDAELTEYLALSREIRTYGPYLFPIQSSGFEPIAETIKTYQEKLRDPRWQKKRLEIFQRDNWTCQSCGNTKECLQVHHLKYFLNTDPWDYPPDLLKTLCDPCHESISVRRTR